MRGTYKLYFKTGLFSSVIFRRLSDVQREHGGSNAADAAWHGRYRADDWLRRVKVHVAGEAVFALRPA